MQPKTGLRTAGDRPQLGSDVPFLPGPQRKPDGGKFAAYTEDAGKTVRIAVGLADRHGNSFYRLIVPYSHLGPAYQVIFTDMGHHPCWQECDIAVLQRISTPEGMVLVDRLQSLGKPVIMDIDDNLHSLSRYNAAFRVYSNGKPATKIFEQALAKVDYVVTSTHRLAKDYSKWREEFWVCENFLPTWAFKQLAPAAITGLEKQAGVIRIGYAGSSSHAEDLPLIVKPLRKLLAKRDDVHLVFFGQTLEAFPQEIREKAEYHGYVDPTDKETPNDFFARYWTVLKSLQLDVALIPVQPNVFNAGKSFLKVLEYGACGWPVIATNFGPYREYRDRCPGAIMVVENDAIEWGWALDCLLAEPGFEKRREMAQRNFGYVQEHHTAAQGVRPWKDLLQHIAREHLQVKSNTQ